VTTKLALLAVMLVETAIDAGFSEKVKASSVAVIGVDTATMTLFSDTKMLDKVTLIELLGTTGVVVVLPDPSATLPRLLEPKPPEATVAVTGALTGINSFDIFMLCRYQELVRVLNSCI